MKKKILLILVSFLFIGAVSALSYGGCGYSVVSRLKSVVSNVNITYDYHIENNIVYFDINITNITPDIYFYDPITDKNYYYSDTNNGEINIYNYKKTRDTSFYRFLSANPQCYGLKLGTKYYKLPSYNVYYNSELCSGIEDQSICKKWVNINYTYDEFKKKVEQSKVKEESEDSNVDVLYKKGILDYIVSFYIEYYYIILIGIIIIFGLIIIINRKKDKFKL